MLKIAALIGAALVAAPAASARDVVEVDGWRIVAGDAICFARSSYTERHTGKDSNLSIAYNAKTKLTLVSFTNTKATSIADGTALNLDIFLSLPNGRYDDGWGSKKFNVTVEDDARVFTSETLTTELLDDFAKANTIGFFTGKTLVSSFGLDGSAKAIAELRKCSFEVAGMNPLDPFLR